VSAGRARAARVFLLSAVFALVTGASAQAQDPSYPQPTGYVVDEAGLLAPETRARLTAIAQELDEKTNAQIAVAVVPSIAPLTVEEYAVRLFERWGVGSKQRDEGVLFVLARDERRVRIEVGYGLEEILPDGRVGGILRSAVVPHLRRDDWDSGVTGAVESLAGVIAQDRGVTLASLEGVSRPPPADEEDERPSGFALTMMLLFVGFLVLSSILNSGSRRRRRRNWWMGPGGFGGFGGWTSGGGGFGGFGGGGGGFGGFGGGSSGGGGASSGF
jgi:uncharacterized protein